MTKGSQIRLLLSDEIVLCKHHVYSISECRIKGTGEA